ncbi:MAG TPA: NAD(P)-binding domain-containing protein [Casimicrobiaceae bacterium]|nr:NAD(P)-binding domain-containing protein [Casimicrobiaceae bacterium]
MNVGYVGWGRLASAIAGRLSSGHQVRVFAPQAKASGVAPAATLRDFARDCDVVIVGLDSEAEVRASLLDADGLAHGLRRGSIVIDQSPGDPQETRAFAEVLRERGVALVDAPVHCERAATFPEGTAIFCGGAADAVATVRLLLEAIAPTVVQCGDSGSGHAMSLVVTAIAACNRLITGECAAVGVKNGLAIEHMATVLNKSSGQNSASARVLPVLSTIGPTADVTLEATVHELKLASQLAVRTGAPLLTANLACCIYEAAVATAGADASIDQIARVYGASAGIDFADMRTWGAQGA